MIIETDELISEKLRLIVKKDSDLEKMCKFTAHIGDATFHSLIFPFFYFTGDEKRRKIMKIWLFGTITGVLILYMIRPVVKRIRPVGDLPSEYVSIPVEKSYSFPSGHSLRNFLMAEVIGKPYPRLRKILYGYAFINGFSRVLLGLHYPLDIIAGAFIGILTGRFFLRKK